MRQAACGALPVSALPPGRPADPAGSRPVGSPAANSAGEDGAGWLTDDQPPPDDGSIPAPAAAPPRWWDVLVVDDDEEVHRVTAFALAEVEMLGRRLRLSHARSAAEAETVLRQRGAGFAVILLDVVMETEHAGLALVRTIRTTLGLTAPRIVLRTGQPGYAPELEVIRLYDINDYRTKAELTRTRLLTSLHSAVRAYEQIERLEASQRSLEQVITASSGILGQTSLTAFCQDALKQINALLESERPGIVLARYRPLTLPTGLQRPSQPVILAASGPFAELVGHGLERIDEGESGRRLRQVLDQGRSWFGEQALALHIGAPGRDSLALYLALGRPLVALERKLLELLSANLALGFDNLSLFERTHRLAYYDPLTGLGNRTQFQLEIGRRLGQLATQAPDAGLAVVLLDLDHFQVVNDGLGQASGDQLLRAVAAQLSDLFSEPGAVSRLNSDLFGIVAPVARADDEKALVEALQLCFASPFLVAGERVSITVSGGFTVVPTTSDDIGAAIHAAGIALKSAKRQGRNRVVRFTSAMTRELQMRLNLGHRIAQARANRELFLCYQPQLRLTDGAVIGVEALLRWQRPDGQMTPPSEFIPAAEDSGQIVSLGEWVLRQSCLTQTRWRSEGLGRLRMAVNVSVRQLRQPDFVATVEHILESCNTDPADLEIEITESAAMEDSRVLEAVRELRALGVSIAIDDFGTGYSSLARLQQLPVSQLKIDRSFVTGIDSRADRRSLASMIVQVGRELGLSVLAEGVETPEEEAVLKALGCTSVQGYLYAKPAPRDQITTWLRQQTLALP